MSNKNQKNFAQSMGVVELPEAEPAPIKVNEDRFFVKIADTPLTALSFTVRNQDRSLKSNLTFNFTNSSGKNAKGVVPVWLNTFDEASEGFVPIGKLQGISEKHGLLSRCEQSYQIWKAKQEENTAQDTHEQSGNDSYATSNDIPLS